MTEHNFEQRFNGVWIRASLWRRADLTWFEKCLLAEIGCFKRCFASNAYLAELMNTTPQTIQNCISHFRKLGLVERAGFDGRKRELSLTDAVSPDPKFRQSKPIGLVSPNASVCIDTRLKQNTIHVGKAAKPKQESLFIGHGAQETINRLGAIFGRRASTAWTKDETAALAGILPLADDELEMVERYYKACRHEPKSFCRTALVRLLRHWPGEVDRARAYCAKHPLRKGKPPIAVLTSYGEAPPLTITDEDRAAHDRFMQQVKERKQRKETSENEQQTQQA